MSDYAYICPVCGPITSPVRADKIQCRCACLAKRVFQVNINAASARHKGRWDPVVGEYVANDREFRNHLRRGQDEQSAKLNMDVKLATVDARDKEGLAELHGHTPAQRDHDLEGTRKAARARAAQ